MSALCTGLAVFGLCLPLPGTPLREVIAAGWSNQNEYLDQRPEEPWFSSRVFRSGTYQLSALVTSNRASVVSVLLMEMGPVHDGHRSPLDRVMMTSCAPASGPTPCALNGVAFEAMPCMGGWLIYAADHKTNRAEVAASCEHFAPLFEPWRGGAK